MQSIYNMRNQMTIIIIAHRLSTLKCCDRVLFLSNGKIKDEGLIDDLCHRYPSLKHAQYKESMVT